MRHDESKKNKMSANATYSTPASGNPPQSYNPSGNVPAQYGVQGSYPYVQPLTINGGTILYPTTNGWPISYSTTIPVEYAWVLQNPLVDPPLQHPVNPPQSYDIPQNSPAQYSVQGSYPYVQALTINGGTILYPTTNGWPISYSTTYPVGYTSCGNLQQLCNAQQIFLTQLNWQNSHSYDQAPAANEGGSQSDDQQSQQNFPFKEDELDVTFDKETGQLMFSQKAKNRIRRKILKTRKKYVSSVLKIQELFYFANCIFCKQEDSFSQNGIDDFGKFFDKYKRVVEKITKVQGIKFENFKYDPTNDGNKAKAEIIYTVLNEPSDEQSYKDTIEKIWNGPFLSAYRDSADQITKSRLRLNLIESTLTEDLGMYGTQELQSELYEYLTPENSGLTQDELDMRKKLLTEANTREELEKFKKNTLASKFQKQKEKLENENKINTSALEGIFILAANNKINIPLEENDGLDSLISNYIKRIKLTNENSVKTLSDIIYTVLYPSVTYMSSKQDNSIIEALKTKLSEIKQEICKKGIECESYLFYTVHKIDKFIDCYESKKSKKQSSESAKPAEQEENSDSNFLKYLINIIKNPKDNVDTNKVKAITTLIKYYTSEQQLKLNGESENPRDQKTDAGSQSKGTESGSNTVSRFEDCVENIIEKTFKVAKYNSFTIDTQHKIANREVDFYIEFNEECSIEIANGFIIPIKAGTKIVIEADGPPHFEKNILPENLEEAQHAIIGKTIARNHEIKGDLINNKDSCDSLKKRVSTLRDKEERLLECACYLQKFRQRRKHLDPTIDSESSKKFYQTEATQDTKKAEQNSGLLEMTPELRDLQEILQDKDVKEVIPESIKKSNLFFSIPLLTSCIKDGQYQEEEIKKVFLNCFINAYCSQALSNLKEFYRQKEDEEKKELENTKTTQSSQQEQNGDQTTRQGENGTLTSNKETVGIRALEQINVTLTSNKETVGIRALEQIKYARDEERDKIRTFLSSMSVTPQNTRTSGQGNTLQ